MQVQTTTSFWKSPGDSEQVPRLAAHFLRALRADLPACGKAGLVVVPVGVRASPYDCAEVAAAVCGHVLADQGDAARVDKEQDVCFGCERVEKARAVYGAVVRRGQVRVGAGRNLDAHDDDRVGALVPLSLLLSLLLPPVSVSTGSGGACEEERLKQAEAAADGERQGRRLGEQRVHVRHERHAESETAARVDGRAVCQRG
jgi:hypothetical protein